MLLGGLSRVYTSLQSTPGLLIAVHIIQEGLPASTQLQLCKDYAKTYAAKVLEVAIHLWHRAHKEKGTKGSVHQSKRNTPQVGLWHGLKMLAALYAVCNETHVKAGFFLCGTCRVSPPENMQLPRQTNTAMLERQLMPTSTNGSHVDSHSGLYTNRRFIQEAVSHLY